MMYSSPNVIQNRNEHDLISDFESEIPFYLRTKELVKLLDDLSLDRNYDNNLLKIYSALEKYNFVDKKEVLAIKAWLNDLEKIK